MNRYILSPCDSELFDLLDSWLTLSWTIPWSHRQDSQDYNTLTNVRKRTLAKPARNNLTTQSVTNLATQPEEQPGDTVRKTTWQHSQKNNLATQPEKQPGETARKTTWRHSQKNNLATQPEKTPGDTTRKTTWRHSQKNNLATQPEKRPSPDLASWQHTMGWRPPSPGIGDRMAPLHKLASFRTRS